MIYEFSQCHRLIILKTLLIIKAKRLFESVIYCFSFNGKDSTYRSTCKI